MAEFFGIQNGGSAAPIYRLVLATGVKSTLTKHFEAGVAEFKDPKKEYEAVRFKDPTYLLEAHQYFELPDFPLPSNIISIQKDVSNMAVLDEKALEAHGLKAVFARLDDGTHAFQAIDRRQVLSTDGLSFILDKKTFKTLKTPALQIGPRVHAYHRNGTLTFESLAAARRFFDMEVYIQEATEEDIENFIKDPLVLVADEKQFRDHADQWVRFRLKRIMSSGIVKEKGVPELQRVAKKFKIALLSQKAKNGDDQLLIPEDKKELKVLLKFLEEDYYEGVLSGKHYVANSKSTT